jgi:hypothetical protein
MNFKIERVACDFPEVSIVLDPQDSRYYVHDRMGRDRRLFILSSGFRFELFIEFNRKYFLSFETWEEAANKIKEIWGK